MNHHLQLRLFYLKCNQSKIFFFSGDYGVLVGDSGYPLRRYLLIPFLDPATPAEEKYNKAQILTRVRVECCFGILKNRFRCLLQPLRVMGPVRSSNVVTAMIVLHNIAIMNRDTFEPLPSGDNMSIDDLHDDETNDIEANIAGNLTRQHYVDTYFSN